jgi:FAD/FMN-containing dehydrogenase
MRSAYRHLPGVRYGADGWPANNERCGMSVVQEHQAFRDGFGGTVILPDDGGYDEARTVWNAEIDRRPAVIARPTSASQVSAAVKFARSSGLEISVRGGSHNYAGRAVCDDGLMIDLSRMNGVEVDAQTRRARAGGGATWADFDAATQVHGLACTGGVISHTGVGGLTLGGGMGWLTRKAGLSCDNLAAVEIVTADGSVLNSSESENPDLFWAVRGGGGNFGIVTTFEYALHEVGPTAHLAMLFWPAEEGVAALRVARETIAGLPEGMGTMIAGLSAPPAPFVPEEHQGKVGIALMVAGWQTAEQHLDAVSAAREALPPLFELITPIPYAELQQMLDDSAPFGMFNYEKALYLDELSEGAIEVIAEWVPKKESPLSLVPIFVLDGAFASRADEDTAFGGSRASRFAVNINATCPTPEVLERDRVWVRSFWDALRPHANDSGSYVNFITEDDQERIREAYGTKYDRLASLKARYDPDNIFHLNANIKPR